MKSFVSLLALAATAIVTPAAAENGAGRVYVANQDSDSVSVIDVGSLEVVTTIAVEDYPHNVNHTPDGRWLLVTNKNVNVEASPSLTLINPYTNQVQASVSGIGERIEHGVSTAAGRAFVSEDLQRNAVAVIDLEERSISAFIPVGVKPHGLWASPDGRSLFVPNQLSGTLTKIDIASGQVVAEAVVGRTPTMAVVTPDGRSVFVTLFGERAVAVVDAEKVETGRMQVNDVIPVGERPAQVAVTPDGRWVLVPAKAQAHFTSSTGKPTRSRRSCPRARELTAWMYRRTDCSLSCRIRERTASPWSICKSSESSERYRLGARRPV